MTAVSAYRTLILLRGCWLIVEWFFGWGSHAHVDRWTLLHPYLALFTEGIAVALSLIILVGLWFFCRWARWIFVLVLALAVVHTAFRTHQAVTHQAISVLPSFVLAMNLLVVTLNGAIIAMAFLPPVRDMFANQT